MRARLGTPGDAGAIARIYNEGIEDRAATFETRLRSEGDVQKWFDGVHPVVVVEDEAGAVLAFASSSSYRERECYAGVFEFSIYVARAHRGRGAGALALRDLVTHARAAGSWKLVSRVFVDNAPCRALLRSLAFREVGTYFRHGKLDGSWRDVVIVEKFLAPIGGEARPAPPSRPQRERLLGALREGSTDAVAPSIDAVRTLIEQQKLADRELLDAALDAFFASRSRDSASRLRFVSLFRAYAALSQEAARDVMAGMFARLGRWSLARDLAAFYEALYVVKQTVGTPSGRAHSPELASHLSELTAWIRQANELPTESRGRISPANVSSLLMSLALMACDGDAQRKEIAELAAQARVRHRVEPPASIRPPTSGVDRVTLQMRALTSALRAGASESAKKALGDLLRGEPQPEAVAHSARAHAWEDDMLALLADLLRPAPPPNTPAHALLAALFDPASRAPGQVKLGKALGAPKRPAKAKKDARKSAKGPAAKG